MFRVYEDAASLPSVWDQLAEDNLFLKKKKLYMLEQLNPCSQTYHLNEEKGIAFAAYRLRLDLFTFSKHLSFKVPIHIIGVPLSVSKPGYVMADKGDGGTLAAYIRTLKGFYVVLNAQDGLPLSRGLTLPTCKLMMRWRSVDEYISDMRSHYRYRLQKARRKFSTVQVTTLEDNRLFDEEMYNLYLEVYERSNEKLEKLEIDFFKTFPSTIVKFAVNHEAIGFVQLVENHEELIFLFGGFKHHLNQAYDLYMNMLVEIIDYGIKGGCTVIDFGQTAEETKLKLGAQQQSKYMYVHHSHALCNAVIGKLIHRFSYKPYPVWHKVFKEDGDEGFIGKMP